MVLPKPRCQPTEAWSEVAGFIRASAGIHTSLFMMEPGVIIKWAFCVTRMAVRLMVLPPMVKLRFSLGSQAK